MSISDLVLLDALVFFIITGFCFFGVIKLPRLTSYIAIFVSLVFGSVLSFAIIKHHINAEKANLIYDVRLYSNGALILKKETVTYTKCSSGDCIFIKDDSGKETLIAGTFVLEPHVSNINETK